MSIPLDSPGALNVFVKAAETRGFTAAGRQLGLSSSAVGKAVARLEDRLGVRLFHRSTRAITLTPEGLLFLERCRRILGELEAAELELSRMRDRPEGVLKVSLPLVGMLMMPTLSAFTRAWPDIELDLDFSDRMVEVIDEGFDAVIRTGEVSDSRLVTRTLGTFRFHLVGAPAYFQRHGVPRTPADLAGHRALRHRYPTTGKLEPWPLTGDDAGLVDAMTTVTVANAIEPLLFMAEQGLGLACLPDFAVRPQRAAGTLISVLDEVLEQRGVFRVLWPSSRYPSPKLRVFIDFMVDNLLP
ncbi:LysR family transcriptional regulator [Alloalcanivorax sp. C16-2]|uniref:LysR family transcriptional regulator n=1 Tax=Alloalcanivorax sp. C16-2 TaxID=3390052 RepID=UPI003970DD6F